MEIIELRGALAELVERGPGEITLGELVPVEGATAEIILAYLPSCAAPWETVNFHLDFRNTSPAPVSTRPVIYLMKDSEVLHRSWGSDSDAITLEAGQSYKDVKGRYWLAGGNYGGLEIGSFIAAIEVYTPEGWVEADRVAGEPFEWWPSLPLPVVTITQAPEYADPGEQVTINFEIFNPGYTNHPSSWYEVNGVRYPPGTGWWWHPPETSIRHSYSFYMGEEDVIIKITPYRWAAPGYTPNAGAAYSLIVHTTIVIPRHSLTITINGNGTVDPMSGEFEEGSVVELTATPVHGNRFIGWQGSDNDAINPTTVTMTQDRQVIASFEAIPKYNLTVEVRGQGTLIADIGEHWEGDVIPLYAIPVEGWWFHSWEGTDNDSVNPTSVTMYSDRHVVCNFTQEAPEEKRDPLDTFIRTMEGMRPKCPVGAIEKVWAGLTEKVIEITPAIKILPPTKGE